MRQVTRPVGNCRRDIRRAAARALEAMEPRVLFSTYTVNTVSDAANPGAGLLTLRQAVAAANAHAGADTVAFDSTVFAPGTGQKVIALTQGPIAFTDTTGTTTVDGFSPKVLTVTADGAGRVFTTAAKTTTVIEGMVITGGSQTAADASGNTYGGAIYTAGTLTLENVALTGNAVAASGYTPGSRNVFPYPAPGGGYGGAVYATGSLTLMDSTATGNQVTNTATDEYSDDGGGAAAGGAIYGTSTVTLTDDLISSNSAVADQPSASDAGFDGGTAAGGGVFAGGTLTVTGTTVLGNKATGGDSGSYTQGNGGGAFGGGLFGAAGVSVAGSTVRGNGATAGESGTAEGSSGIAQGGGVYAGGAVTVTGTVVDANTATGGNVDPEAFTAGGSTFAGTTPSAGGGLYAAANAALSADTFSADAVTGGPAAEPSLLITAEGGGAYVVGTLTLSGSTVTGDSATGGGLSSYVTADSIGGGGVGGGVAVLGRATITGSTLDHNAARGGVGYSGYYGRPSSGGTATGGGVYAPSSALTITNSTIVDDAATGGPGGDNTQSGAGGPGGAATGGGIDAAAGLTLADSTVSGNAAVGGTPGANGEPDDTPESTGAATGGGLAVTGKAAVVVTNSVLSGDTAGGIANDVAGTLGSSSGYDLIGVGGGLKNGTNGNKVGVTNPMLSNLGDNGGPTQTEAPLAGSPVIDAGSTAGVPNGVSTDQRGDARVVGKAVDIGAVEFAASTAEATITGVVFNDLNGDGTEDGNDAGLSGFTVYADVNHDGKFDSGDVSSVTTNGTYTLAVPAGTYTVGIAFLNQYRSTTPTTATVAAAAGEQLAGPTFGQTHGALVSGSVFYDANADGKRDGTDYPEPDVEVYLDANGDGKYESGEAITTTDSAGNWSFGVVAPGTYSVRVLDYTVTTPAAGAYPIAVGYGSIRSGLTFGVDF